MNHLFRLLIVLIILSGCANEPVLIFSSEEFTEAQLEICKTEACSSVSIDYLIASGNSIVSEKINTAIASYIIDALFLGDDEKPTAQNIEDAAKDFIMAYRDHQPDIPADLDFGGYEAEVTVRKTYQNEQIISAETIFFMFTGGAHGYGGTSFLNFDISTGELIQNKGLFVSFSEFVAFAETKFKKANNMAQNDNINASGFWFKDDIFYLPEAIGFDESNLIIVYNSYEITSYASGPIVLEIPLAEVTPFLDSNVL
ncbi:MAG: DUF4163 domain-containing protein [Flavobacteriaceae bacterium]|nr:DUF4163 domain-containing protein [Flavobacteriaceae bacterium]